MYLESGEKATDHASTGEESRQTDEGTSNMFDNIYSKLMQCALSMCLI